MPVRFQCPHCSSRLTVSRRFGGKRGRCPNCKSKVTVPEISINDPFEDRSADNALSSSNPLTMDDLSSRQDHLPGLASDASSPGRSRLSDGVNIPRWVLYVQGGLLGLIATTFFVFGLAVGNTTSVGGHSGADDGTCVISGSVYYDRGQERTADHGAVVIMLPADSHPRNRPNASGLRPDRFEPIRNEAMDDIRALGGCVVRVDPDGNYETELANGKSYWWLVISRNQRAASDNIGKQTRAELGTWFLPIEELLGDREFMWHKVRVSGTSQKMQVVTFRPGS